MNVRTGIEDSHFLGHCDTLVCLSEVLEHLSSLNVVKRLEDSLGAPSTFLDLALACEVNVGHALGWHGSVATLVIVVAFTDFRQGQLQVCIVMCKPADSLFDRCLR